MYGIESGIRVVAWFFSIMCSVNEILRWKEEDVKKITTLLEKRNLEKWHARNIHWGVHPQLHYIKIHMNYNM